MKPLPPILSSRKTAPPFNIVLSAAIKSEKTRRLPLSCSIERLLSATIRVKQTFHSRSQLSAAKPFPAVKTYYFARRR